MKYFTYLFVTIKKALYCCVTIKENNAMTTIAELKASKISKVVYNLTAVIVKSYYSARKFNYGIQYWNQDLINQGMRVNIDGTKSQLVELL